MNRNITNAKGRIIGTIVTELHGNASVISSGRVLGRYISSENRTYDQNNRAVGPGNLLEALAYRDE
jgi:hypothetical protein